MNLPILFDSEKMQQLYKACAYFAKSSLVPVNLRGKPDDILLVMTMANELGVPMTQALQSINVIQGKPTLSPALMSGLIRNRIPTASIDYEIDEVNKVVKCIAKRSPSDKPYIATWNMEKAKAMGLAGKDNYLKQPVTMLKWRATGEACRTVFPDVICGFYVDGEIEEGEFEEKEVRHIDGTITNKELDQDFPIPPEEKEIGMLYRMQNGKFKNQQLKDVDVNELESYLDTLNKREKKGLKNWENDLITVLSNFLENFNMYQDAYYESMEE